MIKKKKMFVNEGLRFEQRGILSPRVTHFANRQFFFFDFASPTLPSCAQQRLKSRPDLVYNTIACSVRSSAIYFS